MIPIGLRSIGLKYKVKVTFNNVAIGLFLLTPFPNVNYTLNSYRVFIFCTGILPRSVDDFYFLRSEIKVTMTFKNVEIGFCPAYTFVG